MKNHLIISLLILLFGCSTSEKQSNKKSQIEHNKKLQKEYNLNDLIEMDNGLWTEKFSDEPISGKVYDYFGEKNNLTKVYIGNLLNGKKEGEWTEWDRNGRKKWEKTYKNGEIISVKYWYDDGKKWYQETYKNGEKDGKWMSWHENGKMKEEVTFKNGKKEGLHIAWRVNGQKWYEVTYKNGKKEGLLNSWDGDGHKWFVITYKDGELNGELRRWSNVGRLMYKTVFIDGNGVIKTYYNNRQKKAEATYRDGKLISAKYWHENGRKQEESNYKDGVKDGLWTSWHENGRKQEESNYKNGVKDGKWTSWRENGKKNDEGFYKNGTRKVYSWEKKYDHRLDLGILFIDPERAYWFSMKIFQALYW